MRIVDDEPGLTEPRVARGCAAPYGVVPGTHELDRAGTPAPVKGPTPVFPTMRGAGYAIRPPEDGR